LKVVLIWYYSQAGKSGVIMMMVIVVVGFLCNELVGRVVHWCGFHVPNVDDSTWESDAEVTSIQTVVLYAPQGL
jgi:hypothetical protein